MPLFLPNEHAEIDQETYLDSTKMGAVVGLVNDIESGFDLLVEAFGVDFLELDVIQDTDNNPHRVVDDLRLVLADYSEHGFLKPEADQVFTRRMVRPEYRASIEYDESNTQVVRLPYGCTHDEPEGDHKLQRFLCVSDDLGLGQFEWDFDEDTGEVFFESWENDVELPDPLIEGEHYINCWHDLTHIWANIVYELFSSTLELKRFHQGKLKSCSNPDCSKFVFSKKGRFCGSRCRNKINVARFRAEQKIRMIGE